MLDPNSTKPHEHPFLLNHGLGSRSDNYDGWESINNGVRGRRTSQNHSNYGSRNGIDWGYREEKNDEHESGVCSPPLWRTSSPPRSPQHRKNHYRSLSPASRAQAIARGQNELMEMVRNMPETCYELSLRDLVEHPMALARQQSMSEERNLGGENLFRAEDNNSNNNNNNNKRRISIDRNTTERKLRSSFDNGGFLLKMVFPVTIRSKTKKTMKKNDSMANNSTTSSKVSPKPLLSDGSAGKGVDKEWWKKRFSVSGESESGDSSINSGSMKSSSGSRSSSSSSRSSSRRHGNGGCWSFILIKKNKKPNQ
ncbi:uncharacterized protein LOC107423431 [Ziziphus jujuba]|uniref:Uncharacterized protein LOC107423431 n=1 Tax=Ziziphus jujuba TaxID=326968 RepID=A0A6P4A4Y7_ZIZJJ|nr:uncharacterized protein LOC107423431 [Ziziphus jujuba]